MSERDDALSAPARPNVVERATYVAAAPCEEFIVPLLARHIGRALEDYAAVPGTSARALDCGCGRQPFRRMLEDMGYAYTGTDVAQNPEGTVDVTCAIDAPLPPELLDRGPFDLLLCTETLEHVADWQSAFGNFAELLKPGGRILLTAPHFYLLHEEPYDFWRPTLHAIAHFARTSGLEVVHRQQLGGGWDVLGTYLGCVHPCARSGSLGDRLVAKAARLAQRLLCRGLRRGFIQRHLDARSPLYLSNLAVLQKPVRAHTEGHA